MKPIIETKHVGKHSIIYEGAIIRKGAILGDHVIVHPHVIIESGVVIGDGVEIFPGAYIGKTPKGAGALARPLEFEPRVIIEKNCSIGPHAIIYYDVQIGQNTLIGDAASIREQTSIGSYCVIGRHVTINYSVTIGDKTKIMDHSWLAGNMTIGKEVFISGGVLTANDNAIGAHGYDEARVQGPVIKDRAMIGLGAKLLPNITVGADAVVGAGAVVTRSVAANARVLGIPARTQNPSS